MTHVLDLPTEIFLEVVHFLELPDPISLIRVHMFTTLKS
jgi:hypothetical protein